MTSGPSFSGDHVNLYGKIYTEVQDQVDGAIEKSIGLFGEECGDPIEVTKKALEIMLEYPSPIEQSPAGIAAVGLQIERDYLEFSKALYTGLKKSGDLSLGLDDFIMANASAHETFVYLLQRRVKSEVER